MNSKSFDWNSKDFKSNALQGLLRQHDQANYMLNCHEEELDSYKMSMDK